VTLDAETVGSIVASAIPNEIKDNVHIGYFQQLVGSLPWESENGKLCHSQVIGLLQCNSEIVSPKLPNLVLSM